ncbi:hypothetical protein NP493_760g01065 [Ridgeia piscesae]|uniref:Tetraspanin n=1 Tax=Ridgeia piscesae TaxID=27915 RepID=A0AAD9KPL7_RIDPI|nr:hypothetical protein NP493_760g01065 [Ridgeia piscesae]
MHLDTASALGSLPLLQTTPTAPLVQRLAHLLIGLGSITVLLSFLGCCGAWAESTCFLCLYAFLLSLGFIAQIVIAILAASFRSKLHATVTSTMLSQVKTDYNKTTPDPTGKPDPLTLAWDTMQVRFNCCGAAGPADYVSSSWFNQSRLGRGLYVPATCCVLLNDDPTAPRPAYVTQCQVAAANFARTPRRRSRALNTKGCQEAMVDWLKQHMLKMIAVLVCLVLVQIFGTIFACVLLARIRRRQNKYPWYVGDEDDE